MNAGTEEAVLITGVFGSGKSSVAAEMAGMLEKQNASYALLDLDYLGWFDTTDKDGPTVHQMLLKNLASVVDNYLAVGVRLFVLARSIRSQAELDDLRAALTMPLKVVRLTVPLDEIEIRLRSDVTTARQDDLQEAAVWIAGSHGVSVEDVTISNDRSVQEVAGDILEWLGWP